jgi:hypothetical protein
MFVIKSPVSINREDYKNAAFNNQFASTKSELFNAYMEMKTHSVIFKKGTVKKRDVFIFPFPKPGQKTIRVYNPEGEVYFHLTLHWY